MRENIHHLRDIDSEGFAVRLARLLNEDRPFLADIDGEALARERCYNASPHEPALEEFRRARSDSVALLEDLSEEDWLRSGNLENVGEISIERLVTLWCAHDASHLQDLVRLAAAPFPADEATDPPKGTAP